MSQVSPGLWQLPGVQERLAAGVRLGLLKRSLHQYSIAGDDSVTEGVTDLVRGTLCPALKALFEHGLKKPSLLGGACHPWLFIEEVITVGTWAWCSPQSFPGFLEEVEGACRVVVVACVHHHCPHLPCVLFTTGSGPGGRERL